MNVFLKNKRFRIEVINQFISDIGEYLFNAVFVIYAANVYKSELAVSIASFIGMFPLVFQVIVGIMADSTNNKKKYIYSIGWIQALLFVGAYFIIGHNSLLSFAVLTLINLFSDVIGMYSDSLQYSYFNKIVPQEDITEASLFSSVMYRIKSLVGPALGVFLLKISNNNYQAITLINAITFMIYAILIRRVYYNLEDAKVLEKENLSMKLKEIMKNILNIYKNSNEDTGQAITLLGTDIILGCVGTAANYMLTVSFVENPFFNISFEDVHLVKGATMSILAILSGLLAKDIFSRWSVSKIFNLNLLLIFLQLILYAINTDITKLIGWVIGLINFYTKIKVGPKITSALFEKVEESRVASVSSGLNFLQMGLLPIITGLMLAIYNISSILAWSVSIFIVVVNTIIFRRNIEIYE